MKNYLIIGGSSGIGLKLTQLISGEGNRVHATYNTHPQDSTGSVTFHPLNVLDEKIEMDGLPDRLDGLAYCPGSIILRPFRRIKPEAFEEDFRLQVTGAVKILQFALDRLKSAGSASVVLFSTVAVGTGYPFHSLVASSKGAVEGLTRSLAAELAPVIRVNCIAPSLTDTPLAASLLNTDSKRETGAQRHPLKRTGKPEDIANMAHYLLSDRSDWITGQVFHVDGGIAGLRT